MELIQYIQAHRDWSEKTFGPGVRTKGLTAHIRKELAEIEAVPDDLEEWVDVMILAIEGAWRAGYSPEQICQTLESKQAKNFTRSYPQSVPEDVPIEHIRDNPSTL